MARVPRVVAEISFPNGAGRQLLSHGPNAKISPGLTHPDAEQTWPKAGKRALLMVEEKNAVGRIYMT